MSEPSWRNPFLGPPPADAGDLHGSMAQMLQQNWDRPIGLQIAPPAATPFHGQGPLLSLAEHAALEQAPKVPGTTVTVDAYPVQFGSDPFNHMYVHFDDGLHSYIYRGGPQQDGSLGAGVMPAPLSPDYGRGRTLMYETFLPGVSAERAVRPAQADAVRVNSEKNPYGVFTSNSNSVVGDFTARQYGHRVGQGPSGVVSPGAWTPGFHYDLPDHPPVTDLGQLMAPPY
jgi:hypothetical protein